MFKKSLGLKSSSEYTGTANQQSNKTALHPQCLLQQYILNFFFKLKLKLSKQLSV